MQILIHKTRLTRLLIDLRNLQISMGDPIQLIKDEENNLAALAKLPPRLPFGIGRSRTIRLGYLGPHATSILWPAVEKDAHLRVRIVEIEKAHLSMKQTDQISISVWGDPVDLMRQ